MNRDNGQASKDVERRRIKRALARLEEAVSRCREEDVRDGTRVLAALEFLALHAREQWPFEQLKTRWRTRVWTDKAGSTLATA